MTWSYVTPILLLCVSNVFMTFAWYGQLKFPTAPVALLIPVCWSIALLEYCFAIPANHIGARVYSPAQLKTIQEVITLTVFAVFSVLYLDAELKWNYIVGFALLVAAVYVIFKKW